MSMPTTSSDLARTEVLYLKIFKITIIAIMTLALIAVLVLLSFAAYQYLQTPAPPMPARPAPQSIEKPITPEILKNFLIQQEKDRLDQERRNKDNPLGAVLIPASEAPKTLLYRADADRMSECASDFEKLAGLDVVKRNNEEMNRLLEQRRANIETRANAKFAGPAWVTAFTNFACTLFNDKELALLARETPPKVGRVLYPMMEFHHKAYTGIQKEKYEWDQAEETRVANDIAREARRVAAAKEKAVFYLSLAAGAFIMFLGLALYLIISKIENHLADMVLALRRSENAALALKVTQETDHVV